MVERNGSLAMPLVGAAIVVHFLGDFGSKNLDSLQHHHPIDKSNILTKPAAIF
jgi:hypothetical protein